MSDFKLEPNEKLNIRELLKDLDKYEPRRRGWHWREPPHRVSGWDSLNIRIVPSLLRTV